MKKSVTIESNSILGYHFLQIHILEAQVFINLVRKEVHPKISTNLD